MAISRLILLCLLCPVTLSAQVNRYFVSFKDKANSPYSISAPSEFLSPQSLLRRQRNFVPVTTEDIPVNQSYIQQVRSLGAKSLFASRWWNGVLIECDATQIPSIQNLSMVDKVVLVAHGNVPSGGRINTAKQRNETSATAVANQVQLQMIGLDKMHAAGLKGEGVNIAIFDSGFQGVNTISPFQALYKEQRLKAAFNFVKNNSNVYSADSHGTAVLSVMSGVIDGSYMGGAANANYFLYQTEDIKSEYRIEEYNWMIAAEKADSAGVDVINSSLGYNTFDDASMNYTLSNLNGKTTVISRAAKMAADRGMIVVVSAGNEGSNSWKKITPPADAEGILAVGSVDAFASRSNFSSLGLTSDGRIKPDVMALGSGTSVILPSGALGNLSGTSLASPSVACLAAGLLQAFPNVSAKTIIHAILQSGSQYGTPDMFKGYGIPDFEKAKEIVDEIENISLYPNPSNGTIQIGIKEMKEAFVYLKIINMLGQEMFNQAIAVKDPIELDISALAAGTYFFQLTYSDLQKTVRVVKQ